MHIAVVGAGAAGLVAARLLNDDGHEVVVLEANDRIGGRVETVDLAPGWRIDVGAHALGSDCDRLLELCKGFSFELFSPWPWNRPDLIVGKNRYGPLFAEAPASGSSLPADWAEPIAAWVKGVAPFEYDPIPDDNDAATVVGGVIGAEAAAYLHATLEHGLGWPFDELSAAYIRSLMVPTPTVRLGYIREGLAEPFRRLAAGLRIQTGVRVTRVTPDAVEPWGRVDAVVLAVPAPVAAELVPPGTPGRPDWLDDVLYSSEVAVTGYRQWDKPTEWIDAVQVGEDGGIGRLALLPEGQWFTPHGWQGAVIGASRRLSAELVARSIADDEIVRLLWDLGRKFDDRLFALADVKARVVTRHEFAWPRWSATHATRVAAWNQRPPLVFAGDWTWHPFVEGAVRSGERAAAAFRRSRAAG